VPQVKTIAVLAANPALTSILAAMLAAHPGLRVRAFDSAIALKAYMRLAPVDLLVADFDCATAPAAGLADSLVGDPLLGTQNYQIIALANDVTEAVRNAAAESGIDEVMVKPMSPKYLLERVLARLGPQPASSFVGNAAAALGTARATVMAGYAARGDNVVPLFRS